MEGVREGGGREGGSREGRKEGRELGREGWRATGSVGREGRKEWSMKGFENLVYKSFSLSVQYINV